MTDDRAQRDVAAAAGGRSGPGGSRLRVRTVEILPGEVVLIDQLALPHEERYVRCQTWQQVAARISDMTVRGAPAIGVTAAGGLALAAAAAAAASPTNPAAFRATLEQAASGLL
jgi:methylthioribose-1-phosphate isomerase